MHRDGAAVCAWRACKEKPSAETGPGEVSRVEGGHGYGGRKGCPGEISHVEGGPGDVGRKGRTRRRRPEGDLAVAGVVETGEVPKGGEFGRSKSGSVFKMKNIWQSH